MKMVLEDYKVKTDWEYRKWNVHDFRGKFHRRRFKAEMPIPGTQLVAEHERQTNEDKRHASLAGALKDINDQLEEDIKYRCRRERASGNAKTFGQINDALERVKDVVKDLKAVDLDGDGRGDEEDESAVNAGPDPLEKDFLRYAADVDVFNVKKLLQSGFSKPNVKYEETGDCALHIAVKHGDVEMVQLLLHFGANPNVHNLQGDAPIHQAWRFWRHHANQGRLSFEERVRNECAEDDAKTYKTLLALLQGGADPDISRTDKSTALHEAARRGPVKAVVVLLQFKATSDIANEMSHTPHFIAEAARNLESAKLIASWNKVRTLYSTEEFSTLWMKFCRDIEASIEKGKSAQQLVKEVALTESQEALTRAKQDGVAVVDEVRSDLRKELDEGSSRRKVFSQKQWKQIERTKFMPKPSKLRGLSVPLDEYLEGSTSGQFTETSRHLKKGSFAHATAQLVGERNFMEINWVEEAEKKKKKPQMSKVRQRRLNVTRAIQLDGADEAHTIRPSVGSILARPIKQTHPVRMPKDAEKAKFFIVEKKMTTREMLEAPNKVLQIKKASGRFDDDPTTRNFIPGRRAKFNGEAMLPDVGGNFFKESGGSVGSGGSVVSGKSKGTTKTKGTAKTQRSSPQKPSMAEPRTRGFPYTTYDGSEDEPWRVLDQKYNPRYF